MKANQDKTVNTRSQDKAHWSLYDWAVMIGRVNANAEQIDFPRFREVMADQR